MGETVWGNRFCAGSITLRLHSQRRKPFGGWLVREVVEKATAGLLAGDVGFLGGWPEAFREAALHEADSLVNVQTKQ